LVSSRRGIVPHSLPEPTIVSLGQTIGVRGGHSFEHHCVQLRHGSTKGIPMNGYQLFAGNT